jgi:ankyrin repeat protein
VQWLVGQRADKEKANTTVGTPLHAAAFNGHLSVVQWLVEQGADKEKASKNGWTPLLSAAYRRFSFLFFSPRHFGLVTISKQIGWGIMVIST